MLLILFYFIIIIFFSLYGFLGPVVQNLKAVRENSYVLFLILRKEIISLFATKLNKFFHLMLSMNSGSWWWTGMLQFMGSQRVRHDWVTDVNWTELIKWSGLLPISWVNVEFCYAFSSSTEIILYFFSLLVCLYGEMPWFLTSNKLALLSCINHTWLWYIFIFMCWWNQVAKIFSRVLYLCSWKI